MFPTSISFKHGGSEAELKNIVTHASGKKLTEEIGVYVYKDIMDERAYSKAGMRLELTLRMIEKMKNNFSICED